MVYFVLLYFSIKLNRYNTKKKQKFALEISRHIVYICLWLKKKSSQPVNIK